MVQAAVATNPLFEASTLELDRQGPSYTVDTVKQVLALYGDETRVNLIIGGDNMPFLKDWHKATELIALCRLIVVPRLCYVGEKAISILTGASAAVSAGNRHQARLASLKQLPRPRLIATTTPA